MRGISWLAAEPVSFSRRTLLHGVSKFFLDSFISTLSPYWTISTCMLSVLPLSIETWHEQTCSSKHAPFSWFQTFAVIWILYIFFWVFPRRQIVVGRRFGTLYQFHLQRLGVQCTLYTVHPAFEYRTDTGFRNVGQLQFDAGEIPRRKYTTLHFILLLCEVVCYENLWGQISWCVAFEPLQSLVFQ